MLPVSAACKRHRVRGILGVGSEGPHRVVTARAPSVHAFPNQLTIRRERRINALCALAGRRTRSPAARARRREALLQFLLPKLLGLV